MKRIFLLGLVLFFPIFTVSAKEYGKDDLKPCLNDDSRMCDAQGNLLNGSVEKYYPDKTLKYKGAFADGRPDGIQKDYYENGKLKGKMNFKKGQPIGIWKNYFEDGKLAQEVKFEPGKYVMNAYDNNGNKLKEVGYIDGEMVQKEYYKNSKIKSELIAKADENDESYQLRKGLIIQFKKDSMELHTPVIKQKEAMWKRYREDGGFREESCKDNKCVVKGYDETGKQVLEMGMVAKDGEIVSAYQEEPMGQRKEIDKAEYDSFGQSFNGFSMIAKNGMDLYNAASAGDLKMVQELVADGYNVNTVCQYYCKGWTPVMIASANGHFDTVKFLLDHGANPNAQNYAGRTALMFATRYGFIPIIEVLLEHGADPTITSQDENQNSAMADILIYSLADQKAYDVLKLFVKKTGQVNFELWDYIPLMMAVKYDDYDFAKYLLDNGANPNHVKIVEEDGKKTEYHLEGLAKSDKMKELIFSYRKKK